MRVDSCFELGHVIKYHGIRGEVDVFLDVDEPGRYAGLESVFIEQKRKLVPYFIERINLRGNRAIIKFEEIRDIDDAKKIISCKMFLPLDHLPDLGKNRFYLHEIIGFTIHDKTIGKLGKVTGIYDANGNRIAAMTYLEKEILLPMNDTLILGIDKSSGILLMDLPDGLLDVYLNP
jgi:16S rRNA processing protein RimM